jgi:hypothetical protein
MIVPHPMIPMTPKIKVQKLEDPAVQAMYQKAIEEKTSETTLESHDKDNVDKIWKTLIYTIMNTAMEILEYENRPDRNDLFNMNVEP